MRRLVAPGLLALSALACSAGPAADTTPTTTTTDLPSTTTAPEVVESPPEFSVPAEPVDAAPAAGQGSTTTTTEAAPTGSGTAPATSAPTGGPVAAGRALANDYDPSGPCGGDLPPCWVMRDESGGDPTAVNPTGCGGRGCYGKWQFDPRTSQGLGYLLTMDQYPEPTQDDAARALWAGGDGCSHWAAC